MKTKDAFALRGLYLSIVDFDEYGNPMEFAPDFSVLSDEENMIRYNSLTDDVAEALLGYIYDGAIKYVDRDKPALQQAKELQALDKERLRKLVKTQAKIERHIVRLQKISRQLFNQIVAGAADERLKGKGARAERLTRRYEYLQSLFNSYEVFTAGEWRKHEEKFQRVCRRQFGSRLRQARLAQGLTQEALARQLNLVRTSYNRYESGQSDLATPTIYRIADVLKVSLDWLYGLKD